MEYLSARGTVSRSNKQPSRPPIADLPRPGAFCRPRCVLSHFAMRLLFPHQFLFFPRTVLFPQSLLLKCLISGQLGRDARQQQGIARYVVNWKYFSTENAMLTCRLLFVKTAIVPPCRLMSRMGCKAVWGVLRCMISTNQRELTAYFHRNGVLRTRPEGDVTSHKGYEVRLVAFTSTELERIRILLEREGYRVSRSFVKGKRHVQPVYGKHDVDRFIAMVMAVEQVALGN